MQSFLNTGTESSIKLFLNCNRRVVPGSDLSQDRFSAPASKTMVQTDVYQLLAHGLTLENHAGLSALPLTACVYGFLGREGTQNARQQAVQMFDGTLTPRTFLLAMERDLVCTVIRVMAATDTAGKDTLFALQSRLYASSMST